MLPEWKMIEYGSVCSVMMTITTKDDWDGVRTYYI